MFTGQTFKIADIKHRKRKLDCFYINNYNISYG